MNDFKVAKYVQQRILTGAASVFSYSWDDGFCLSEIKGLPGSIKYTEGFEPINPNNLTREQMEMLGFGVWDNEAPFMLIPFWMLEFLCDQFWGGSISSNDICKIHIKEIDNDQRFGFLAFGAIPAESELLPSD